MTPGIRSSASRRTPRPARRKGADCPRVRIVVLTYNAGAFIRPCLNAVLATDYPDFEVTVVDNASSDGSVEDIGHEFPDISLVQAGANLGFARGNNLAMQGAGTPFVALLNPDTQVDVGWLRPLVQFLQDDPIAGGVGPKILFSDDRVAVNLRSPTFIHSGDAGRSLGIRLYEANDDISQVFFNDGVYGVEVDQSGARFRWTNGMATVAIPVRKGRACMEMDVSAGDSHRDVPVSVAIGDRVLWNGFVNSGRTRIGIDVPDGAIHAFARPVIENAGIKPLVDGSMRDRGTFVTHGNVWHAWDGPAFNSTSEVFAVKGGAALYRSAMLESLDFFDPGIFMYYEDTDLAWRARRRGWRFFYKPESVVRHAHAAISGEWSPAFVRNVEFGKLRMLAKNAPWTWTCRHMGSAGIHGGHEFRHGIQTGNSLALRRARARASAIRAAFRALPDTVRLRRVERRLAPLDGRELQPFLEPA